MDKKNKRLIISLIVIAAIMSFILYTSYSTDNMELKDTSDNMLVGDISIGTLLPLTGDLSSQGENYKAATEMAALDFNKYLKSNNAEWSLNLVHEDSGTNPVIALQKLTSLNAKNIHMVVGPSSSGEIRNIIGYANSNGIIIFSQGSTAPSLAIPGDNVFRLTPDDSKQGPAIATLLDHNGIDAVIQIVRADAWGDGLSKSIEDAFTSDTQNTIQTIRYNPESPEFSVTTSLLAKLVQEEIAIHSIENVGVMAIGFAETLQFMQSASEHEILDDVLWFGTDGVTKETKITNDPIASKFANKVQFTTTLLTVNDNDIRRDLDDRFISQLGATPKSYAYSAYDIVWIFGLAMEKADSNNVDKIIPIIPDIAAGYNGAIGNARLNEAGDLDTSDYDVWKVIDSKWVTIGHYDSSINSIIQE